jgi:hypothetical protein
MGGQGSTLRKFAALPFRQAELAAVREARERALEELAAARAAKAHVDGLLERQAAEAVRVSKNLGELNERFQSEVDKDVQRRLGEYEEALRAIAPHELAAKGPELMRKALDGVGEPSKAAKS